MPYLIIVGLYTCEEERDKGEGSVVELRGGGREGGLREEGREDVKEKQERSKKEARTHMIL